MLGVGRRALPGRPRRRDRHHGDGAPLQHRAVAAARAAHRREAEVVRRSPTTAGSTCPNIDEIITEKTKIVSFVLVSNILGTVNPVEAIVRRAQEVGALVCIDASQAAPHMPLDVQALQRRLRGLHRPQDVRPDRHRRALGPPGAAGGLPPFLGGGEMIETVSMHSSTYAPRRTSSRRAPRRSPQAVGLGAAVDYLSAIGMDKIPAHEHALTEYAVERLREVPGLRIIGPATAEDRGARSPSRSATSTRTTWARSSTSRASRSGSATTARGRSACGTEFPRPRGRRSICTPRRPRSTPWSTVWSTYGTSSGRTDREAGLDVPGSHPGPLQAPARARSAGSATPRCTTSTRRAATRSPCG